MNTSRRSILKWSASALAASPIIGGLTLAITAPSAAQQQRDAARREGLPLTPEDLRPQPPVRDVDNAAPLLRELTQLIQHNKEPAFKLWDKASADLLKNPDDAKLRATFQEGLTRYAALIATAEQAATLPHCDFNYDYAQGPNLLLPELATFRQLARLFTARALLAQDASSAFADIARAAKLGNLVAETPILIAALVYCAVHAIADKGYHQVLKRFGPSALAKETLQAFGPSPDPEFYLRSEVVMGTATMKLLREGKLRGGISDGSPDGMRSAWNAATALAPLATPIWERQLLAFWREMYSALRATRGDSLARHELINALTKRWERSRAPQDIMVVILIPVFSQAISKTSLRQEALRQLRASAVQLLEEKAATGHFPDAPTLPTDPFSLNPLRYLKEGEHCRVYSIGEDKRDDGGAERSEDKKTLLDIVVQL